MTDRTHQYTATRIRTLFLADPTYTLTIPEIAQKLHLPMWRRSSIMRALRRMPDVTIVEKKKNLRGCPMNVYRLDPTIPVEERRGNRSTLGARIAKLLKSSDEGMTLHEIATTLQVNWTSVQYAIHRVANAYVDRWTVTDYSGGQYVQVWCLSPDDDVYPHCPKPDPKGG